MRLRTLLCLVALAVASPVMAQPEVDALRLFLGTSGSTCVLHAGSGAPSSSLGGVCDTYQRTDSPHTKYIKTGVATWSEMYRVGGTDVAVADGGTGLSSFTTGQLLYASGSTTLAGLSDVAAGSVLASGGVGVAPAYSANPSITTLTASTSLTTPSMLASANLTLGPTGNLILNPTGNSVLPTLNYDIDLGSVPLKFKTLSVGELLAETLVAQDVLATIGGSIFVAPTTVLTADLSNVATTITVKQNPFTNGDHVLMKSAPGGVPQFEKMTIASSAGGSAGAYTYTVTRNVDGTGANSWYAGDAVVEFSNYIDIFSTSGVLSGAGPSLVGNVRQSGTWNDIEPRWALGNLNGLYGYSTDTFGAAFGDIDNAWLTIDSNGLRAGEGATTYLDIDGTTGNATFAGRLTVGTGRNLLANSLSAPTVRYETSDGDGTDWGQLIDDHGQPHTSGCNVDNRRLEDSAGNSIRSACYFATTGSPASGKITIMYGPLLPVDDGLRYEWSAYCGVVNAGALVVDLVWYNAAGSVVSTSLGTVTCASTNPGTSFDTWGRVWTIATAPGTAVAVRPRFKQTHDGSPSTSTWVSSLFFAEAGAAQTTPSPFAPGGMTTITGDYLATDLVMTNTLRSPAATALGTGTGFWLDSTGTPTFRVGNPSGDYLRWDGSNLGLISQHLAVGTSGIRLTPSTSGTYATDRAFRFDGPTGDFGLWGADFTNNRMLRSLVSWTGAHNASLDVENTLSASYAPTSGGGSASSAVVEAVAATGSGQVTIAATGSSSSVAVSAGTIALNGLAIFSTPPRLGTFQFTVGASGGAAALPALPAGYITIDVGGTQYVIPAYTK